MIGSPGANNNYAFFGNKVRNTIFFSVPAFGRSFYQFVLEFIDSPYKVHILYSLTCFSSFSGVSCSERICPMIILTHIHKHI